MLGFFILIFYWWLFEICSIKKNIENNHRENFFYNKAIDNNRPWYIDKNFQMRDIKTHKLLWIVTKNNIDYICYYPTEQIYLNLTNWNYSKKNKERRIYAHQHQKLGYKKLLTEKDKKIIFGDITQNQYYNLMCEIDNNGNETGNFYKIKTDYKALKYYLYYFNTYHKKFEEKKEISKIDFLKRSE